jgi:hypothetical protein
LFDALLLLPYSNHLGAGQRTIHCSRAAEDVSFGLLRGRKVSSLFFQGLGNKMIGRNNPRRRLIDHAPSLRAPLNSQGRRISGGVLKLRCSGILGASLSVKILCHFQICGVFYPHSEKARHADVFGVRFGSKVRARWARRGLYLGMPVNCNNINELSPLVPIVLR